MFLFGWLGFFSQMQRLFFCFFFVCFAYRKLEISMSDPLQVRYFRNLHDTEMMKPLQRRSNTTTVIKINNFPFPYMLIFCSNDSKTYLKLSLFSGQQVFFLEIPVLSTVWKLAVLVLTLHHLLSLATGTSIMLEAQCPSVP